MTGAGIIRTATTLALLAAILAAPSADAANTMAVEPDGTIVVVGRTQPNFGAVARLMPDGRPDRSFGGGDGIVVDRRFFPFTAVALQPDGRIVVAAPQRGKEDLDERPVVGRYLPDGSPDPEFAAGGAMEYGAHPYHGFESAALVIGREGEIVLGGTEHGDNKSPTEAVAKSIAPDGTVTGTFGAVPPPGVGPGVALRSRWTGLADVLPLSDGSMIVAGTMDSPDLNESLAPMVARIGPAFGLAADPSFGGGAGILRPEFGFRFLDQRAETLVADGDGAIVGGSLRSRMMLTRFSADGILDTSFGSNGLANPSLGTETVSNEVVDALSLAGDGSLIAAATDFPGSHEHGLPCEDCSEALLARFDPSGGLDRGFGGVGVIRPFGDVDERLAAGSDVAVLPDGRILFAGSEVHGRQRLLVARFQADGRPDRDFGRRGLATITPCPGSVAARRRSGCLPSASVWLRSHGLAGRHPGLRIRVRPTLDWARIAQVELKLPPELRARNGQGLKMTVIANGRSEQTGLGEWGGHGRRIIGPPLMNARQVILVLPPGCIERRRLPRPGRRLLFAVKTAFQRGSHQTIAIRRPG